MDEYRLTARGAQGVNNLKATPKVGKSSSILLVNETSELMVISQWGKIIRLDTKTVRAAGRATQGVRLLNLDAEDKVAAAVIIPPEEVNGKDDEQPTLLQYELVSRKGATIEAPFLFHTNGIGAKISTLCSGRTSIASRIELCKILSIVFLVPPIKVNVRS